MAIPDPQFRRLIETHQRMVFSLALRLLGDYATAEEVAQDVFLELYRSGERLENEDHVRFWLRRTAKHRAIDATRRAPQALHDLVATEVPRWRRVVATPLAGRN